MRDPQGDWSRQEGTALILALLFVLVLAVIGTVAAHIHATTQLASARVSNASNVTYARYSVLEIAERVQSQLLSDALSVTDVNLIGNLTVGGPSYAYHAQKQGSYSTVVGDSGQTSYVQDYVIDRDVWTNY